ncbi:MAG: hypothetical protein ABR878_12480 [Roseiarcus sp.]|jgi:hypothetical protein
MGSPSRLFIGSVKTTARRVLGLERPHVLVACMPKSASTFLADVLAKLPGIRHAPLTWAYGWREQTLDVVQLARYDLASYVCQQHLRYSADVGNLIVEYRLTPVVLTRNVFDVVASIRDHFRNESTESPMVPLGPKHAKLGDAALEELIADLVAPWYVSFFVSWQGVDSLRVTFDQVRTSPSEVVSRICERAGIRTDERGITRAIEAAHAKARRFNKGVSGRGEGISPKARERIVSLARHFPDVDFTPIGIARPDAGAAVRVERE